MRKIRKLNLAHFFEISFLNIFFYVVLLHIQILWTLIIFLIDSYKEKKKNKKKKCLDLQGTVHVNTTYGNKMRLETKTINNWATWSTNLHSIFETNQWQPIWNRQWLRNKYKKPSIIILLLIQFSGLKIYLLIFSY